MKCEYKVGDVVIGVKDDPVYPKVKIVGKIGIVKEVGITFEFYYRIDFKEQIDFGFTKENTKAYWNFFKKDEIKLINAIKLKKLLED